MGPRRGGLLGSQHQRGDRIADVSHRRVQEALHGHLGGGRDCLGLQPIRQGGIGRQHAELLHHVGGVGRGVRTEVAADGVAEPVPVADRRIQPARGRPVHVALQVGRMGTFRQSLQGDILPDGRNDGLSLAAQEDRPGFHGLARLHPQRLVREEVAAGPVRAVGAGRQQAHHVRGAPQGAVGRIEHGADVRRTVPDKPQVPTVRLDGHQREGDPGGVRHQAIGAGFLVEVGRGAGRLVLQVLDAGEEPLPLDTAERAVAGKDQEERQEDDLAGGVHRAGGRHPDGFGRFVRLEHL